MSIELTEEELEFFTKDVIICQDCGWQGRLSEYDIEVNKEDPTSLFIECPGCKRMVFMERYSSNDR